MNLLRKFCNWYFSRGTLPYWCILAMDCTSVFMSGLAIYYLKYGGLSLVQHFWQLTLGLVICLMAYVVAFFAFHTFRGVMRYSSFVDLSRIAYSNIAAGVFVCLVHQLEAKFGLSSTFMTPRFESAILIYVLATSLMWGLRVIVKTLHDTYRGDDSVQKVFIYGCMQGGVALAKSIRNQTPLRYRLRGFISSDKSLDGSWLLGERVHFDDDSVVELMQKQKVRTLLVSPLQTENFTHRTTLIEALIAANIKIMMMPQSEEWDGHSDLSHQQLREVEIEDLLPREKIEVDMAAIGQMLRGKRILITGAAGSIGSEMARQVAKFQPAELVLVDQAETPMHDMRLWMNNFLKEQSSLSSSLSLPKVETIVSSITDQEHMEKIFSEHRPEYVFHAAAYKHVPMMEDNPGQAVRNNIYGTRVIADLAVKYGTKKFVMISTDKAVNPTNVMGCSKRICEIYCQALNAAIQEIKTKTIKTPSTDAGSLSPSSADTSVLERSDCFLPDGNAETSIGGWDMSGGVYRGAGSPGNTSAHDTQVTEGNDRIDSRGFSGFCQNHPNNLLQVDGSLPVTQFVTTRFGNVLGSNGSVIPIFREQIKKGGPVKVTHPDIIRYFMLIPEACRLVLEAGTMGKGGEIFVFDMGEPVKIVDLAKRMIALSGARDVKIEFSGLRDGEKLFEELLATKENTKPTHHPKIMVAQVREYPYDLALQNEIELHRLSQSFDDMAIVRKMKQVVPEFKSQNSKYSALDN